MENNSFLLSGTLILFQIFGIIILEKNQKAKEKNKYHYEAIADVIAKKNVNITGSYIQNILILLIAGFFLSNKELIILYFFYCILQNITFSLKYLITQNEILQIKNGLFNTYFLTMNPYWDSKNFDYKFENYMRDDFGYLVFYYKDKQVFQIQIFTEDKTEEEVKKLIEFEKQKFKDYMRYIPLKILTSENPYTEIDYWYTYFDELRN